LRSVFSFAILLPYPPSLFICGSLSFLLRLLSSFLHHLITILLFLLSILHSSSCTFFFLLRRFPYYFCFLLQHPPSDLLSLSSPRASFTPLPSCSRHALAEDQFKRLISLSLSLLFATLLLLLLATLLPRPLLLRVASQAAAQGLVLLLEREEQPLHVRFLRHLRSGGWVCGWMDGWVMDGWMDGWMEDER
jgi:hypothetical protein